MNSHAAGGPGEKARQLAQCAVEVRIGTGVARHGRLDHPGRAAFCGPGRRTPAPRWMLASGAGSPKPAEIPGHSSGEGYRPGSRAAPVRAGPWTAAERRSPADPSWSWRMERVHEFAPLRPRERRPGCSKGVGPVANWCGSTGRKTAMNGHDSHARARPPERSECYRQWWSSTVSVARPEYRRKARQRRQSWAAAVYLPLQWV